MYHHAPCPRLPPCEKPLVFARTCPSPQLGVHELRCPREHIPHPQATRASLSHRNTPNYTHIRRSSHNLTSSAPPPFLLNSHLLQMAAARVLLLAAVASFFMGCMSATCNANRIGSQSASCDSGCAGCCLKSPCSNGGSSSTKFVQQNGFCIQTSTVNANYTQLGAGYFEDVNSNWINLITSLPKNCAGHTAGDCTICSGCNTGYSLANYNYNSKTYQICNKICLSILFVPCCIQLT